MLKHKLIHDTVILSICMELYQYQFIYMYEGIMFNTIYISLPKSHIDLNAIIKINVSVKLNQNQPKGDRAMTKVL